MRLTCPECLKVVEQNYRGPCLACLRAKIELLSAIAEAAWLVRTEDRDCNPCPDYGLRATYRQQLNTLLDDWNAAKAAKGESG